APRGAGARLFHRGLARMPRGANKYEVTPRGRSLLRPPQPRLSCERIVTAEEVSMGARRLALAAAVAAAWCAAHLAAQSPNAFGVPSADKPNPGADVKAARGSRAQGWLDQGRSEVLARHGIVSTSDPLA